MRGSAVGRVIASKSKQYPKGAIAVGYAGWTELAVLNESELERIDLPRNGKPSDALSVLGMTGLTAYFGMLDVGKVKPGDTVVVSGAAGATGSVAGQIAKIKGAKVIGIAGSNDKVQWLKDLGFDDALNYKDSQFKAKFREATKGFIDVFFDNVGGEILDLALARAKPHARFVICGGISQYNSAKPQGPKNFLNVISMRIRVEGFIVFDYQEQYAEARRQLSQWLSEGKLQRRETIIKGGIGAAEQALADLYKGINTGKLLVEVVPDEDSRVRSHL